MGSRVRVTEAEGIALAKSAGLNVTNTSKIGTVKQLLVGKVLVQYDKKWGGCACWRANNVRVGYKGEAIAEAVKMQPERCYFRTAGKLFKITAILPGADAANAYMKNHRDEGVIYQSGPFALLAKMEDKGIEAAQ